MIRDYKPEECIAVMSEFMQQVDTAFRCTYVAALFREQSAGKERTEQKAAEAFIDAIRVGLLLCHDFVPHGTQYKTLGKFLYRFEKKHPEANEMWPSIKAWLQRTAMNGGVFPVESKKERKPRATPKKRTSCVVQQPKQGKNG